MAHGGAVRLQQGGIGLDADPPDGAPTNLYRIGDEDELHATGFDDLVGRGGATVVEWADRFPGALPRERLEIRLEPDPARPTVRRLLISGFGERHSAMARALSPRSRRVR